MKYENECKQLLRDSFFDSWMDEKDWEEFEIELFKKTDLSYEKLSKSFEEGVQRGYPIEFQLKMIKKLIENEKRTI